MSVVVVAHTVRHPGAVVVHPEHTALALPTVVGPRRLIALAHLAVPRSSSRGLDLYTAYAVPLWLPARRYAARICEYYEEVIVESGCESEVQGNQAEENSRPLNIWQGHPVWNEDEELRRIAKKCDQGDRSDDPVGTVESHGSSARD